MPFIELVAQRRSPTPPPGMQPPENAKDWFRIDNSAEDADETDVYVYDSIGGWFGMYADEFIEAIGQVTTSKINLRLNSPGGSVFEGIAIANAIRSHPATVTVYVDSVAASIASVIALAGDRVVMMPQSQFMVHNASGACYGDATEMTKMADLLDKQSRNIAEAYAQHTGRPLAEWQAYMDAETWFTAEEAVAAGLADEAIPMKPKKAEQTEEPAAVAAPMNRTWDLSMYQYAGRANAPAPALAASGVDISNHFADGITPEKPETIPGATEGSITIDFSQWLSSNDFTELLTAAVRKAVQGELEDASKKLPAFLQPDEDEEEETEEEETDDASDSEPEAVVGDSPDALSASDGDPPPALDDTGPGAAEENVERTETDEWLSLVDRLTDSPSPSADDVFTSLKEAW